MPDYFILIIIALIGVSIYLFSFGRKLPIEKGLTPIFEKNYGGRVGWTGYNGKVNRLAIYPDFIILAGYARYQFNKNDIKEVVPKKVFFIDSFQIVHNRPDIPNSIVLTGQAPRELIDWLKS